MSKNPLFYTYNELLDALNKMSPSERKLMDAVFKLHEGTLPSIKLKVTIKPKVP